MSAEIRWLLAFHRVMLWLAPIAATVREAYRLGVIMGRSMDEGRRALNEAQGPFVPLRPMRAIIDPPDPEEQGPCVVCRRAVTITRSEIARIHRLAEDTAHRKEMWRAHCCARHGHPFQRQQKGASA